MRIFDRIARIEPFLASARGASARGMAVALAIGALSLGCALAQTAPAKGSAETPTGAAGFSIESEMLTYRALQSNSEAIACDIAAFVNGTNANFKDHSADSVCEVKAGANKATVVLLPFN